MNAAAVCGLLTAVLLAGCATAGKGVDPTIPIRPVVDPGARKAALAALSPSERRTYCYGRVHDTAHLSPVATIGGPIRRQQSNAQRAGNVLFENIAAWYLGREGAADAIRRTLAEGARIRAFAKLARYSPRGYTNYNPMNEPAWQVANFMVPLAHAYAVLEEEYPEETDLLSSVRQWGDRLFEATSNAGDSFRGRARGADRRALIAAGWALWGNVTGNRDILARAYRYYLLGVESIGHGGVERLFRFTHPERHLYYANMTYGAASVAAHALYRSGAGDVYTVAPGGGTLVEGVTWLWTRYSKNAPADLLRRHHPGSRGVGWVELFVREFPGHTTARDMETWLAAHPGPYYVNMGGGPTTCLFRRITANSF